MEIIKDAKLVNVENRDGRIILTFLGDARVYEVTWNLKRYDKDNNDWIDSPDKEAQVEEWAQKYFKCSVKDLDKKAIGRTCDVYAYDTFASLWESDNKFTAEDKNKKFQTTIDDITVSDTEILITYKIDDKKYKSKMSFTQKVGEDYFLNPIKQKKQLKNFEDKYGVPIEQRASLIGQPILVKVKSAFGKYFYGDIEPLF